MLEIPASYVHAVDDYKGIGLVGPNVTSNIAGAILLDDGWEISSFFPVSV